MAYRIFVHLGWAVALGASLATGITFAQTATGSISGSVRDPSGGAVVNAQVNAINVATNEPRTTITNNLGYYTFPLLPPATYRLEARAPGFKRFVRDNIKLDVALALTADVPLEIGDASESVTVSAEAVALESETSSLGHIMENQRILNLPLNGRNSYGFAALVPGVRASAGFSQVAYGMYNDQFVSINGSRPNQNSFLLDGGANSEPAFNGPGIFPSVDSVQEYKVQTNNFSAEFSHAAGGVINVVTKSGSNEFHGTLFEFLRNDKLTANDFFVNRAGQARSTYRFNQFGGTVGGPVILPGLYHGKDRTFFFVSYEGLRWISGLTAAGTMPTDLQRAGDFSRTFNQAGQLVTIYDPLATQPDPSRPGQFVRSPFSGNVIPQNRIDPVAANILKYLPHGNAPGDPVTQANNFVSNFSAPITKDTVSARVDHALSANHRFYARFTLNDTPHNRPAIYGAALYPGTPVLGNDQLNQRSAVANYTGVLKPNFVLELSSSFIRYSIQRAGPALDFDPVQLGFPGYFHQLQPSLRPCFPSVGISGLGVSIAVPDNGGGLLGSCGILHDGYETFQEVGNFTYTHGAHTFKFGASFGADRLNTGRYGGAGSSYSFAPNFTQGPNPLAASASAGVGFASFLLGNGSGSINSDGPGQNLLFRYYGFYFQDDWKITPKLTVNLGIRYDYDGPWTERYNRITDFDYNVPSPISVPGLPLRGGLVFPGTNGIPRGQFNPDRNNFAPRLGFAYAVNTETVVRGGAGIFYAPITGGGYNGAAVPISGFQATTTWVGTLDNVTPNYPLSNPFPLGFQRATGSSLGLATLIGQAVTGMDRTRTTPYAEQWNFDIQRTLPVRLLLDVAYAGSRGLHLFGNLNVNQLPNQLLSLGTSLGQLAPNPFYGLISTGTLSPAQVQVSQLLRPYPQFTAVTIGNTSYGASTYHALQAKLERRFSNGFSLLIAYTYSKIMDDVGATTTGFPGENFGVDAIQDYNNRRNERAPADFDSTHYFAVNSVYELPAGSGKKFLNHGIGNTILGGWQLNGIAVFHSGFPLEMTTAVNNLFNYGGTQRPNWSGQDPTTSGSMSSRINQYFNPAVFSQPAPYTFGNVARQLAILRSPGLANLDLSVFKNFPIHERLKLQFRAEAFNLMNHPQFGPPNTSIGTPSAGVISAVNNAPRNIQLALKLLF
jgi:outer membrane receptor protein involved in Fe transport